MSGSSHRGLCRQCSSGLEPGKPKTFDPKCRGCKRKLAAGLRTGLEPRPQAGGFRRTRFENNERKQAQVAAMRASYRELPRPNR